MKKVSQEKDENFHISARVIYKACYRAKFAYKFMSLPFVTDLLKMKNKIKNYNRCSVRNDEAVIDLFERQDSLVWTTGRSVYSSI